MMFVLVTISVSLSYGRKTSTKWPPGLPDTRTCLGVATAPHGDTIFVAPRPRRNVPTRVVTGTGRGSFFTRPETPAAVSHTSNVRRGGRMAPRMQARIDTAQYARVVANANANRRLLLVQASATFDRWHGVARAGSHFGARSWSWHRRHLRARGPSAVRSFLDSRRDATRAPPLLFPRRASRSDGA